MSTEKILIPDPFANNLNEVANAQDITDELDLNESDPGHAEPGLAEPEVGEPEISDDEDKDTSVCRPRADGSYDVAEVQANLEAVLFVADRPLSQKRLAEILGLPEDHTALIEALEHLRARHAAYGSGIELVAVGGGLQLRTKVAYADAAKRLAKVRVQKLSRGALETLAIVAYKQPVLKDDIDQVRGVDSAHFVRNLLERGLIEIQGRSELPGRPMLYTTTQRFLEVFGLMSLSDMPSAAELEGMVPGSEVGQVEDPRVIQIRNMLQKLSNEPPAVQYSPAEDEAILAKMKEDLKAISVSTPALEAERLAAQAPGPAENNTQ